MSAAKAIAAGIVGLVGVLLLRWEIELGPELEAALLSLVLGIVVYMVPNRPSA